MNFFSKILRWIKFRLLGYAKTKIDSPQYYRDIFSGPHDCSLVALMVVMPDLQINKVKSAFMLCCKRWPYAGVNNKDFNVSLRHLGIFDNFEYDDSENQTVRTCLQKKKRPTILLIDGHFFVIRGGKIYDEYFSNYITGNTKVYFSWELKA